ncbi:hypothetical protein ACUN0C_19110 [Faunimonas sp. B44]|uniref:hypothetical protein n=1 Tax=Faunimonas sp. B44 TaxID=3461493 RepID=UPI004043BC33
MRELLSKILAEATYSSDLYNEIVEAMNNLDCVEKYLVDMRTKDVLTYVGGAEDAVHIATHDYDDRNIFDLVVVQVVGRFECRLTS